MTTPLRSAGEAGTNKSYGDFTNLGYYGKSFDNWDEVLEHSGTFGMLYYTDEQRMNQSKSNTITLLFDEGDISLNKNQTYYLYLWTYYQGHYYPDNLFMVLRVKDGTFGYASATGRNSYGSFTDLWELVDKPSSNSSNSGSVTLVRATVTEPKSGKAPDFTVLLPATASTTIKEVEWIGAFDDQGCFQDGEAYTVKLTVGMDEGHEHKIFNIKGSSGVRVNGNEAKLESVSKDKKQIVMSYTFPKLKSSSSSVTNLNITFPALTVGSTPPTASQTTVSNSSTYIKDVEWVSDYDGDTFVDNRDYTVYVTVAIKDGVNKTFDLSKVTMNGNTAAIDSISSDKKQVVIAGNLSLAEVMVLASRIHADHTKNEISAVSGEWYISFYSYCQKNGLLNGLIISEKDMNRPATRYEMVAILDRATSKAKTSGGVNTVNNGFIPDVKESDTHGEVVYRWYRSGIVTGDSARRFNGSNNITRAEVSVILCQLLELVDRAKI